MWVRPILWKPRAFDSMALIRWNAFDRLLFRFRCVLLGCFLFFSVSSTREEAENKEETFDWRARKKEKKNHSKEEGRSIEDIEGR